MRRGTLALWLALCALAAAPPALGYDARRELDNLAKPAERWPAEQADLEYQMQLRRRGLEGSRERNEILLRDPERNPLTLCASHFDACAGDPRMHDFAAEHGVGIEVGFTNRNGAHISGHVWAPFPRRGERPRSLPLAVIVTGAIQANEQGYWHVAQVLAQRGFAVLTFDIQGQGRSDAFGAGADRSRGFPAPVRENFVTAVEDALDFALSSEEDPYVPRSPDGSQTGQTEAQAKQARRAQAGLADGFNPLAGRIDPDRVGLAGHSFGASAVSLVGQRDPRVDAVVAWNNLESPPDVALTKPSLGIASDYGLVVEPYVRKPDPEARNEAFHAFRARAPEVDVMQLTIRGGTHWEFPYIPNPAFAATLRGIDLADWYTSAWLERYVAGDERATARILSDRWLDDAAGARVDRRGDGNLLSFHYRSRIAIHDGDGAPVECDDVREGCEALVPRARDGHAGEWSYLREREAR